MEYTNDDEFRHRPGTEENWQESVWVQWYDRERGVGGLHRIGLEPHDRSSNCVVAVFSDEGTRFRRIVEDAPLDPEGSRAFDAGDVTGMTFEEGRPMLTVKQPECELSLAFHDYHPRFNFWDLSRNRGQDLMDEIAPGHYEVGGRVTGELRLGENIYEIDGLGYRDHSWGPRDWGSWLAHRWLAGTVGPGLSFSFVTIHGAEGQLVRTGYVVKDGEPIVVEDIDILVYIEPDGFTHRGGRAVAHLPSGEEIRVQVDLVDGVVIPIHEYAGIDTVCRVSVEGYGEGFADLEMSNNARNGREVPSVAIGAALQDGLTMRGA